MALATAVPATPLGSPGRASGFAIQPMRPSFVRTLIQSLSFEKPPTSNTSFFDAVATIGADFVGFRSTRVFATMTCATLLSVPGDTFVPGVAAGLAVALGVALAVAPPGVGADFASSGGRSSSKTGGGSPFVTFTSARAIHTVDPSGAFTRTHFLSGERPNACSFVPRRIVSRRCAPSLAFIRRSVDSAVTVATKPAACASETAGAATRAVARRSPRSRRLI